MFIYLFIKQHAKIPQIFSAMHNVNPGVSLGLNKSLLQYKIITFYHFAIHLVFFFPNSVFGEKSFSSYNLWIFKFSVAINFHCLLFEGHCSQPASLLFFLHQVPFVKLRFLVTNNKFRSTRLCVCAWMFACLLLMMLDHYCSFLRNK